jgi:hypothetical protein
MNICKNLVQQDKVNKNFSILIIIVMRHNNTDTSKETSNDEFQIIPKTKQWMTHKIECEDHVDCFMYFEFVPRDEIANQEFHLPILHHPWEVV